MSNFICVIPNLLLPLFQILIMKRLMKTLLGAENTTIVSCVFWVLYYVFLVFNNCSDIIPQHLLLAGNISFVFFISALAYKNTFKQKCAATLIINTIWMLVEIIVMLLLTYVGFNGKILMDAGGFISNISVLLISVIFNRVYRNYNFFDISWRYFFVILLIPITSIYIMHNIFLIASKYPEYSTLSVSASLMFLLINYVLFEIYDWIRHDTELREQNCLYEQQLDLCSQQAEERENTYIELQKMRHNLKKYFYGLLGMLQEGQVSDAQKYISDILNESIVNKPEEISTSGNIIVDSLINHEYGIAMKNGIDFNASILIPASLPFHNGDLSIILGNLLENAIEACCDTDSVTKYITLNISYVKDVLQISLKNSCGTFRKKDNSGNYLSTKNATGIHGLGLSSVKQAIEKYQGIMNIYDSGNEFQIVAVLYGTSAY